MSDGLSFKQVFASLPRVLFPYDQALPVQGSSPSHLQVETQEVV